jgi:hypothetical protein
VLVAATVVEVVVVVADLAEILIVETQVAVAVAAMWEEVADHPDLMVQVAEQVM